MRNKIMMECNEDASVDTEFAAQSRGFSYDEKEQESNSDIQSFDETPGKRKHKVPKRYAVTNADCAHEKLSKKSSEEEVLAILSETYSSLKKILDEALIT